MLRFHDILIILVPVLLMLILLLKKQKKSNVYILFFSLFYMYLCGVLNYTQFPILSFSSMRETLGQNVWQLANFIPFSQFALQTSLLNILLTIPFGFGIRFITHWQTKTVLWSGLLLGLTLEGLQLAVAFWAGFTFRVIDIDDVIFNFIGVVVGYALFRVFIVYYRALVHKLELKQTPFIAYIYHR